MKKVFFILLLSLISIMAFAEEKYVQEDGKLFKVVLSDTGDTLSKEEIIVENAPDVKPIEIEPMTPAETAAPSEYDEQLFKRFIPYKWQIGWYGAWQGIYYGMAISTGLELEGGSAILTMFSVPSIMFFAPPLIIREDIVNPRSVTFVDWGYRLGPVDYFTGWYLKQAMTNDSIFEGGRPMLYSALWGYLEAWGGYVVSQKYLDSPRASGDFYATGAVLGYVWGGLLGTYLTSFVSPEYDTLMYPAFDTLGNILPDSFFIDSMDSDNYAREKTKIVAATALSSSIVMRLAGYMYGANSSMEMKSGDAYVHAFNTLPGLLMTFELDNYITNKDYVPLIAFGGGIASTALSMYLFKDVRFDDGNAILMQVAGMVGGLLFQGIERAIFFDNEEMHSSFSAIGIIGTEALFYYLRKDEIGKNTISANVGMNVFPTENNGLGVGINYRF